MNLIQPQATLYTQGPGTKGLYEAVRDAAAVCYQTDVEKMKLSPKEFVENVLLKNGHTRPLEFGTVYMKCYYGDACNMIWSHSEIIDRYLYNHWSRMYYDNEYLYITTNLRVIMQGDYDTDKEAFEHGYDKNWLSDIEQYGTDYIAGKHAKRHTIKIIGSRGAIYDFRTHIELSSICESTRYCNYSKDKFGNSLTFIDPVWWKDIPEVYDTLIENCRIQENNYMRASQFLNEAQMLKRIIPLEAKAELRLCGYDDAWDNFLWRRCDRQHVDPECVLIANEVKNWLEIDK